MILLASYLLLFCCFGAWKRTFFRSNFSLVLAFSGFVVFSVRALLSLCVSACFFGVFMGSGLFLSILFVILGLSFLHCSVLMSLLLFQVLAARLSVWVIGLPFYGNALGGSFGYGQQAGLNILFGFSHNRGVWVKQALSLRARVLVTVSLLQNHVSSGSKEQTAFNFVAGNATKIGVSGFFGQQKSRAPPLFTIFFYVSCCDLEIYGCYLGLDHFHPICMVVSRKFSKTFSYHLVFDFVTNYCCFLLGIGAKKCFLFEIHYF